MIQTGLDRLIETDFATLKGCRTGVISNQSGVDRRYRHLVDLMPVTAVFGPEHGFRGSAQAGGSEGTTIDPRTGVTVFDAYGADQARWQQMFADSGIDVVVFDIQDVGARFYTYISTLYDSMAAAGENGLRFVVLDRPNPCGGKAYGPVLKPGFESFAGRTAIAQQHGMTMGELASLYNGQFLRRSVELQVMWCPEWRGEMLPRIPWVAPSPNIPRMTSALAYTGTGMFEGTNLSEGRGTTSPFEMVGAPYLDYRFAAALQAPGVYFREAYFIPAFSKHQGRVCAGVELKIHDAQAFDAVYTATAMLIEARKYDGFEWNEPWIDKLTGSSRMREMIDAGANVNEVNESWQAELDEFDELRAPHIGPRNFFNETESVFVTY